MHISLMIAYYLSIYFCIGFFYTLLQYQRNNSFVNTNHGLKKGEILLTGVKEVKYIFHQLQICEIKFN